MAQRLNRKLYRIAIWLIFAYFVLSSFRPMLDNVDLGWHIAQGRWMVQHGTFYRHDVLNYPTFGRSLVDEYPLFQIVLYLATKLGWWGPCLLTALGYVVLIGAVALAAAAFQLEGAALLVATLFSLILYLQLAFPLRPHLATYLGVILTGIFLLRHRAAKSWLEFWPVAVGQIAWTNCHSGFVLGPIMVALFGVEITARRSLAERAVSWAAVRVWAGAFLLILLACFVNPFGARRFGPPFYQDQLESIRAYVSEMQPLTGGGAIFYQGLTLLGVGAVGLAVLLRRGSVSYSFLLLALLFYFESLSVQKAWPIFALFLPLLILSTGAFAPETAERRLPAWPALFANFLLTALLAMAVISRLDPHSDTSLSAAWHEYDLDRSELSLAAIDWMRAHGVEGRLLHRSEDGGCLQEAGYDRGQTFGDTGFGKYDESFIRQLGLLADRPALLPAFLKAYQPDYVACGTLCYAWPWCLRQNNWRLIFYSPGSSVWARADKAPEFPTVSNEAAQAIFLRDEAQHGRPRDPLLYARAILTLHSMGLEDFAFSQLTSLPSELHRAPWYWEAARMLCFETPRFSAAHRDQLFAEAEGLHADALTAEFRAYTLDARGDSEGARRVLTALAPGQLGGHAGDLLLKIELAQNRPETLALAERTGGFDLRDGLHWQYVAQAEMQAGHQPAAARAWRKAVYYYPDDAGLMQSAAQFAAQSHDAALQYEIASAFPL
jgi:hypothetical protein